MRCAHDSVVLYPVDAIVCRGDAEEARGASLRTQVAPGRAKSRERSSNSKDAVRGTGAVFGTDPDRTDREGSAPAMPQAISLLGAVCALSNVTDGSAP